ncbi:MAG: hypothetical protein ACN4GW_12830 [Desulforhopalus sp.]
MVRTAFERAEEVFIADHALFWTNLSRLNGLLIILNISMFFLTGLVAKGYYYTCYSLAGLGLVGIGMLIPTRLVKRLGYYWIFVAVELVAAYFLVASVIYWMGQGG